MPWWEMSQHHRKNREEINITLHGSAVKKIDSVRGKTGQSVPQVTADAINLVSIYAKAARMYIELPDGTIAEVTRMPRGNIAVEPLGLDLEENLEDEGV